MTAPRRQLAGLAFGIGAPIALYYLLHSLLGVASLAALRRVGASPNGNRPASR